MDNKKPKKKVENPVREWISDNLRYIMLIGAIALIILIAVFFVLQFSKMNNNTESSQSASAEVSEISKSTEAEAAPEAAKTPTPKATKTPEATVTPEAAATPAAEKTAEEEKGEEKLAEADENAAAIVKKYFDALAQGDAATAASVVESLSEDDIASITAKEYAQSYQNVSVYTIPGDVEGAYVAFVVYEYKYEGYDAALPAMTELYVFTREDGSLCIGSEQREKEKAAYLDSVLENEDVKALQASVQQQYDQVIAANPALAEYINSQF